MPKRKIDLTASASDDDNDKNSHRSLAPKRVNEGPSQLSFVDSSQGGGKKARKPTSSSLVMRHITIGGGTSSSKKRPRGNPIQHPRNADATKKPPSIKPATKQQKQRRSIASGRGSSTTSTIKKSRNDAKSSVSSKKSVDYESDSEVSAVALPRRRVKPAPSSRSGSGSLVKRGTRDVVLLESSGSEDDSLLQQQKGRRMGDSKIPRRPLAPGAKNQRHSTKPSYLDPKRGASILTTVYSVDESDDGDADLLDDDDKDLDTSLVHGKKSVKTKGKFSGDNNNRTSKKSSTATTKSVLSNKLRGVHGNHKPNQDNDDIPDDELEVPYAQNLGLSQDQAVIMASTLSNRRKEPLRPGDVIFYYNPVFVAGTQQSIRVTQVVQTDPARGDFPLELDNGELLPADTRIKRIKEYHDGQLYDHPGIFRGIDEFLFGARSLSAEQQRRLPRLKDQVTRLMEQVVASAQEALQNLPQDLENDDDEQDDDDDTSCSSTDLDDIVPIPSLLLQKSAARPNKAPPQSAARSSSRAKIFVQEEDDDSLLPKSTSTKTSITKYHKSSSNKHDDGTTKTRRRAHQSDSSTRQDEHDTDSDSDDSLLRENRRLQQRRPSGTASIDRPSSSAKPGVGLAISKRNHAPVSSRGVTSSKMKSNNNDDGSSASSSRHSRKKGKVASYLESSRAKGTPRGTTIATRGLLKKDPPRNKSLGSFEPNERANKETDLLWDARSSDDDLDLSVADSSSATVSKKRGLPEKKQQSKKPSSGLTLTRPKSSGQRSTTASSTRTKKSSSAAAAAAISVDPTAQGRKQLRQQRASAFRPTSLEPDHTDIGLVDSSEDENRPENGHTVQQLHGRQRTFFPSAARPDEDRIGYASSISSATWAASPSRCSNDNSQPSLRKQLQAKRRARLLDGGSGGRSDAATSGGRFSLTFQAVPRSGSRTDF